MTHATGQDGQRLWEPLRVAALILLSACALVHLMTLPVFADEGAQMRWIYRIIESGEWLAPFGDGKPLEAWPMVPFVWLGAPALLTARALHVLAGVIGVLLVYRLAGLLGGRGVAWVSGALFAICPFAVYLERLALSDMFLCAAGVWVLVEAAQFLQTTAGSRAIRLSMALLLAGLCKLPVGFALCASVPLALVCMPSEERRRVLHGPPLKRLIGAHVPVAFLGLAVLVAASLRVRHGQTPGFGLQDLFGIGLGQYRDIPVVMGVERPQLASELSAQLSWPVMVLGAIGLGAALTFGDWRRRWLIAAGMLPMLAIGYLAQFWFSRYLLFTLPPLIVAAVSGWQSLGQRAGRLGRALEVAALALSAGIMAYQSALIVWRPVSAQWSPTDRYQYFEAPGSGYGFPEAAAFVLHSPRPPSIIYSLDGHSAYQLLVYLPAAWRDRVKPIVYGSAGEILRAAPQRLENLSRLSRAWIICPELLLEGELDSNFGREKSQIRLSELAAFDKPGAKTRLGLYEVEVP